jgi:hypothetical protein
VASENAGEGRAVARGTKSHYMQVTRNTLLIHSCHAAVILILRCCYMGENVGEEGTVARGTKLQHIPSKLNIQTQTHVLCSVSLTIDTQHKDLNTRVA